MEAALPQQQSTATILAVVEFLISMKVLIGQFNVSFFSSMHYYYIFSLL
jgi:hypothetical protein